MNNKDTRQMIQFPAQPYWEIKKAALERNMSVSQLLLELWNVYAERNRDLIERGIIIND